MEATKRRKKCKTITVGSPIPWDNLPSDILEIVFKNLPLGDRVRVGSVCINWNLVMGRAKADILRIPEAPWRILSKHFPDTDFITEVSFKSLSDENTYRFYLPDDRDMGWFCGSSGGWLLMAGGNRSSYISDRLNPDLFLWNPLNGSTKNLPRMATHPCYAAFRGGVTAGWMSISRLFDRVHVFSHGSAECVVAAVLNRRVSPTNQISLCTPGDGRWTTFGESVDMTIYIDVRYLASSGSLWLLATSLKQAQVKEASRGGVCLSGCTVPISLCFLDRNFRAVDGLFDRFNVPQRSLTLKDESQVFRLVEDTVHVDGDVLVVATHIDRRFHVRHAIGSKETVVRDRTGHVSFIVPFHDNRRSEELASVENRTVFLGSTGTDSIVVSDPMRGIEADCVYLAIDDSHEFSYRYNEQNRRLCTVQEQGVYFLKSKKMRNDYSTEVGYCPPIKIGWFEPKIFLK